MVWISEGTLSDEEYTAKMQKEHPEYFDLDGSWLPTALTGATGPAGVFIPTGEVSWGGGGPKFPEKWKPTFAEPVPRGRCVKINPSGKECNRLAILGADVCEKHAGGPRGAEVASRAEAVVAAARERMLDLIDPSMDVLKRLVTDEGVNDAIQLKAVVEILDRNGMVKGAREVNVNVETHSVDWTALVQEKLNNLKKKEPAAVEIEAEIVVEEE